jgi:predicted CoA-substrate-specific enzyme activase
LAYGDFLHLGIDVGSTTVKAVALDSITKKIVFSKYERHNACQSETVLSFLKEIFELFNDKTIKIAVCGSGGKVISGILRVPYVQEVVANSIAVRALYPMAKTAIELGGQDAKIIFFKRDPNTGVVSASDMRMNGSCAGGTGAFIDEVAALLRLKPEDFEKSASLGGQVYDISGRCGVFAKTDIQPLLNQGAQKPDVALSAFHAIAKQTIGGLAQGMEITPPVIFEGGPITFNPTLIKVFSQRLNLKDEDVIHAENPEIIIAYGAALSIDELFSDVPQNVSMNAALTSLSMFREIAASDAQKASGVYFASEQERLDFLARHKPPERPPLKPKTGGSVKAYLGIDAGSTTSKFVLLDENEDIIDSFYASNKGEPLEVIRGALAALNKKYEEAGVKLEIAALGTTGYGELLFDKAFGADYHTVETVAHLAAAQKYVPDVSFILDIGGQDMKAISVSNGVVTNITLNEACSSGCGSFLENFATTLGVPVEKIADAAFSSRNPAQLGSRCTVFMNSTIITEQKNGKQSADVMAGLCRSIIENVFTKVLRVSNTAEFGNKIVVQGGTFKNDAVLCAFEQYLGKNVVRAPFPGEMGAIGIAILTKREIEKNGYTSPHGKSGQTRFIGLNEMYNFSYTQESNLLCKFCANSCNRTLLRFSNGLTWVTGNRCERGEITGDANDPDVQKEAQKIKERMEEVEDMTVLREELLFKKYAFTRLAPQKDVTIGLPRSLDFWRTLPFWDVFFNALGFKTLVSPKSGRKLFESGLQYIASDTVCFPAKLAHGHIQALAAQKVDRIFFPQLNRLPPSNHEKYSTFTCPVLKSYPLVIKFSDDPQRRRNIAFDSPVFHWFSEADRNRQLCAFMRETFNISEKYTLKAIAQGEKALESFYSQLEKTAARIIADAQKRGKYAVVLAGRPYQYDSLINHNLSRHFTSMGIPVVTLDALPEINRIKLRKTRLDVNNSNHAQLLSGALIAAENPALEYVQIYSFGCGHDALYTDETARIMNEISGKAPLVLKLDESDVPGPLRIRVRSFIETVNIRRAKETLEAQPLKDPYPVKFTRKDRRRVILVPNVSRAFCLVISAVIKALGFKAEPMPMGGPQAIELGKKYVHNDVCFPAQMLVGESISAIKNGPYKPKEVAIGVGKLMCDCRLTNYMVLTRKALDAAGYSDVPIVSTDLYDLKKIHPYFKFNLLALANTAWGLVQVEMLEDLRRKIRPYEKVKGETDRVAEEAFVSITNALAKYGMAGSLAAYKKAIKKICAVRYDRSKPKTKVLIVGEYFLVYHPGSNYNIEKYLEDSNLEVILPRMYDIYRQLFIMHYTSEIKDFKVRHSLYNTLFGVLGDSFFDAAIDIMENIAKAHPLFESSLHLPQLGALSDHIIHHSVMSGESFLIPADIIHHAQKGVKLFIILQPFGCLPNHICGRGVIRRVKEMYPDIQILPLDYEADASFANIENRLQMLLMNARM